MNILYTEETLIQYYYGECEILETLEIENTLENDINSNLQYAAIYESIQELSDVKLSPSQRCLDAILNYSKA